MEQEWKLMHDQNIATEAKNQAMELELISLRESHEATVVENMALQQKIEAFEIHNTEMLKVSRDYSELMQQSQEQENAIQRFEAERDRLLQDKALLTTQLNEHKEIIANQQEELDYALEELSVYESAEKMEDGASCSNCLTWQMDRSGLLSLLEAAQDEIISLQNAIQDIHEKKEQLIADVHRVVGENNALKALVHSKHE